VGGTEAVTRQEYCEILGKEPKFVENSKAWPIWADTTKMVEMLGPNKVSVREGVRRFFTGIKEMPNVRSIPGADYPRSSPRRGAGADRGAPR
jgi:hypothetical protein